jgi:prophage tail gpP-like protein
LNGERLSPIDAKNLVSLEVGGIKYDGWKSVRIKHSVEHLAGTFTLDVSDRWPDQTEAFAIEPGATCTVMIGDDVMITGYIDIVQVKATAKEHTITVEGRDKTGDLVDCSAPPMEWLDMLFEDIAAEVCAEYGIDVIVEASGGIKLPRKSTNTQETCHKLLDKMAKIQGVMMISDRLGNLKLTRAGLQGEAYDMLVLGENLTKLDYERSFANLYSSITVKSQVNGAQDGGGGQTNGDINTKQIGAVERLSGAGSGQTQNVVISKPSPNSKTPKKTKAVFTVENEGIDRHRPLIIIAEDQATDDRCQLRAEWEAGTREAKSKKINVQVQGWRQSNGAIWEINTLVYMRCPWVKEDQVMLISAIEFSLDMAGGTVSNMTIYAPEAYDVLPVIPQPDKHSGKYKSERVERLSGAR